MTDSAALAPAPLYLVRPGIEADLPFVFNSWLRSYRDAPAVTGVPNSIFFAAQHAVIERLLPQALVGVACSPDDQSQIFGYIVARRVVKDDVRHAIIDWLYIKQPFRGFGIARDLVGKITHGATHVSFTHRPRAFDRYLARPAYQAFVFNPYLVMVSSK